MSGKKNRSNVWWRTNAKAHLALSDKWKSYMDDKYLVCLVVVIFCSSFSLKAQLNKNELTFCNPIDLPYMFQPDGTYRSAADPVIVLYKDVYWLFVSKNKGYYRSEDLVHWQYIKGIGYPTEIFAPAVCVLNGKLYLTTGAAAGTFTTNDPASGIWHSVALSDRPLADPATFVDTDGSLYLYDDCSDVNPIRVTKLNPGNFRFLSDTRPLFKGEKQEHGWEVPGDSNELVNKAPWIEGSWMNKINGKYYLQYAAPGTQYSSYGDGVYVGDNPMGPFVYAPYSPFSFKPTGFVTGAGHSATFEDLGHNLWHVSTLSISVRHMFERRIGLFPTGVLPDGQLVTNTYLGDYPQYMTADKKNNWRDNTTHWMLLSYHKPCVASSTLTQTKTRIFKAGNAFDEDIRSWWSAASNNAGEWLQVDLEKRCRINALQINFADQGATMENGFIKDGYGYYVAVSNNAKDWKIIVDHRKDPKDAPHDYEMLSTPVYARYIKIVNDHSPAGGLFSLFGLRVFGQAPIPNPSIVLGLEAKRDSLDARVVQLHWNPSSQADFYIIRYGIAPDKLWNNYQVYGRHRFEIRSLNKGVPYFFSIDAVNAHGITKGKKIVSIRK